MQHHQTLFTQLIFSILLSLPSALLHFSQHQNLPPTTMLDPRTEPENNHNHNFDIFRTINDRNDSWRSGSLGARAKRTGENYQNFLNLNAEGVQFRPQNSEDGSGVHSPPLWKSSPPRSPSNLRHNLNIYRSLSPTARTDAIARGQRELMEMVKNMPESSYELTLKDLVVDSKIGSPKEESCLLDKKNHEDHQVLNQKVTSRRRQEDSKNSEKKAQILRSASMENRDLFLKMVFPISFKSRKKKNLMNNSFSKVSPKPEITDKTSKTVDNDWWKKRSSGSSESDTGRTSTNSGTTSSNSGSHGSGGSSSSSRSNSGRKKWGFLASCFSCFYPTESKSTK